jgi:hypothetical protein
MPSDPRLADMTLLVLAARRCQARTQLPDWRSTEGISSLLAAAKALPQRGPWEMPSVDDTSGLAGLLKEARAWQRKEVDRGA